MSITKITSKKIDKDVLCNTSKSHSNRALIACALSPQKKTILNLSDAQDVVDMLRILQLTGVKIDRKDNTCHILNSFPACEKLSESPVCIEGSEGGTTIRFILPLLALGKNEYHIQLKGSLVNRPMSDLMDNLKSLGAQISQEADLIKVKGPIKLGQKVSVDCSQTTQFASALTLLKIQFDFELELKHLSFSETYLRMTNEVVQYLKEHEEIEILPDFSSLGYFVAYGLTTSDIKVLNVKRIDRNQADAYFFKLMDELQVKYQIDDSGLYVPKSTYPGFSVDSSNCIDLVPTLMYLACFATSESQFTELNPLKLKESNRLEEMLKILQFFGVNFDLSDDVLTIYPGAQLPEKNSLNVAHDHRMVMVGSLFFKNLGGGSICPSEAVVKSFPQFFSYFR